jgi:hypothetical protein
MGVRMAADIDDRSAWASASNRVSSVPFLETRAAIANLASVIPSLYTYGERQSRSTEKVRGKHPRTGASVTGMFFLRSRYTTFL